MKTTQMLQPHEAVDARAHLLAGTPSRHDAAAAAAAVATKGYAMFVVKGDPEAGEEARRVEVPVVQLGHPRMRELLAESSEEYGFEQEGVIVIPCGVERFMRAVEASASAGHGHGHHHHHFRLPHIHIARCFRPSHVVA